MAGKAFRHDAADYDVGIVRMAFGVVCNLSSDPTKFYSSYGALSTTLPTGISAVTYSATGIITLTFRDQFYTALSANVHLQLATAADSVAQFNGFTNLGTAGSTLTAAYTTVTAGTAATIAAADTSIVWCHFIFKNSSAA